MTVPPEEFKALVEYANSTENFVANKVNIIAGKDNSGVECWTIMAFQDIFEKGQRPHEIRAIHIILPKSSLAAEVDLSPAASAELKINSASYFKIINIDYETKKSTELTYLGKEGSIKYKWSTDPSQAEGNFGFNSIDNNNQPFKVNGYFHILNRGAHTI